MIYRKGLLFMGKPELMPWDFRVKNGKFQEIGPDLKAEENEEEVDLQGAYVYPGMVEAHSHLGLHNSGTGYEGNDVNEMSHDPITPNIRAIDGINVLDDSIPRALAAGVTTAASGPGSANVVGGTFCAFKLAGRCIDEMVIKDPVAMKAAFGENPKRVYREKKIYTRMQIAAMLRELLEKTKEYAAAKKEGRNPAYDAKLEAMIPVIEKKIPLKCHAHQHNDIATILRIAAQEDIRVTLDHCTEGHLIIDTIAAGGFPAIIGPTLSHKSKLELANKTFATCARFYEKGIPFSITTDAPVTPLEYLPICAGLAVQAGLPEAAAIEAITLKPAQILGLDSRIGSIETGKDADFFITDRPLLDLQHHVLKVWIDGQPVYPQENV